MLLDELPALVPEHRPAIVELFRGYLPRRARLRSLPLLLGRIADAARMAAGLTGSLEHIRLAAAAQALLGQIAGLDWFRAPGALDARAAARNELIDHQRRYPAGAALLERHREELKPGLDVLFALGLMYSPPNSSQKLTREQELYWRTLRLSNSGNRWQAEFVRSFGEVWRATPSVAPADAISAQVMRIASDPTAHKDARRVARALAGVLKRCVKSTASAIGTAIHQPWRGVIADDPDEDLDSEPIRRDQRPPLNTTVTESPPSDDDDTEGLSESDAGDTKQSVTVSGDASDETAIAYSAWACFRSERENQFLPWRWETLNPHELSRLSEAFQHSLTSPSDWIPAAAAVALLKLTLARSSHELLPMPLYLSLSEAVAYVEGNGLAALSWDGERWWEVHRIPQLKSRWLPKEPLADLEPVDDTIVLQMPDALGRWLAAPPQSGITLGSAMGISDANHLDRKVIRPILLGMRRRDRSLRLLEGRIERCLFDALFAVTSDETLATMVIGPWMQPPNSGLFYTAVPRFQLRALHWQALGQMLGAKLLGVRASLPTEIDSGLVGSRLQPRPDVIRAFAESCRQRATACIASARTSIHAACEAHNAYVGYCLAALSAVTAHRPVKDPFWSLAAFDPERNIVVIADKASPNGISTRVAWLPKTAIAFLDAYKKHLRGLASIIARQDRILAARILSVLKHHRLPYMPFFFRMSAEGGAIRWQSITRSSYAELWPDWNFALPPNAFRHVLSSSLRRGGLPGEFVNYVLGHVELGQLPTGRHSPLSIGAIAEVVLPRLETILSEQGFVPIDGIRPFALNEETLPRPPTSSDAFPLLGPHARMIERQRLAEARVASGPTSEDGNVVVIPVDPAPSPFRLDEVGCGHLANGIRRRLVDLIASNFESAPPIRQLAFAMASSVFLGGLLQLKRLRRFPRAALSHCSSYEGWLWITLKDDPLDRWVADPFTAVLIVGFHRRLKRPSDIDHDKVVEQARLLIVDLIGAEKRALGLVFNIHATWPAILGIATASMVPLLPGYLRTYVSGSKRSACLPDSAYARLFLKKAVFVPRERLNKSPESALVGSDECGATS